MKNNLMKKKIAILTIGFILSFGLLLYPFVAEFVNKKADEQLIVEYEENVSDISSEELIEEFQKALLYNQTYEGDYDELLNILGDGMMGYIEIPSIDIKLPIYHYATDEILNMGVGHLESSSLPVGGNNTHCILTGHRGIPGSTLFTNLDQVELGDVFYIHVSGETLAYEVTDIQTVLPEEIDSLTSMEGNDLCTLVTCTPYGINTHRLLVTGSRIDYTEDEESFENTLTDKLLTPTYILLYLAIIEIFVYFLMIRKIKKDARQTSS